MILEKAFIALIFFSSLSWSAGRKPDNYITACEAQIDEKLKELNSKNDWTRVVDSKPNHKTYRSPTNNVGEWVEIVAGEMPSVYQVTPRGIREFGWNLKTCELNKATAFEIESTFINISGPTFKDSDLKRIIEQKDRAIIYTFSPRMVYSIKYMDEMSDMAESLGYKFIPVLEPTYKIGNLGRKFPNVKNFKIQKAASVEIVMRQMLTHLPSSLVISNGHIMDPIIIGVKSKDEYESEISRRSVTANKK